MDNELRQIKKAFWSEVDRRVEDRCQLLIRQALQNLRPGGMHPFLVEVVSPSASTSPVIKFSVDYPCIVDHVCLYGQPGESVTAEVDLYLSRPGEALADSTSICSSTGLPTITTTDMVSIDTTTSWAQRYLESGSILMPIINSVSGCASLTIDVSVRAV